MSGASPVCQPASAAGEINEVGLGYWSREEEGLISPTKARVW